MRAYHEGMGKRGRPPGPGLLTPAEERVLDHIRQGQTNAEIAVRLGVSVNTVRYHVSNLLSKTGVGERRELARWRPPSNGPTTTTPRKRRPAWLWLGLAGAGGFGLIAVAAVAFAPTTDNAPAATLPAGYQVYTAQELEAMGMV